MCVVYCLCMHTCVYVIAELQSVKIMIISVATSRKTHEIC